MILLFTFHQFSHHCKYFVLSSSITIMIHRADSRFAPSQWETALLCNDVSHWLGASLESVVNILHSNRHLSSLYPQRHLPPLFLFVASVLLVLYLREEPLPTGPPYQVNTTAFLIPPRGRDKKDGSWVALRRPFQVYAYTAFFDDRHSLGSLPVVRVIAALEKGQKGLKCIIWSEDGKPSLVVEANPQAIGVGVSRAAGHFTEYVIGCPLDSENIPSSVSLVYDVNLRPPFKLPVEVPERLWPRHDFVVSSIDLSRKPTMSQTFVRGIHRWPGIRRTKGQ